MSRYVVRVIGPSGMVSYLHRATYLVSHLSAATAYPHPSAARRALDSFDRKGGMVGRIAPNILDLRDPEREVP